MATRLKVIHNYNMTKSSSVHKNAKKTKLTIQEPVFTGTFQWNDGTEAKIKALQEDTIMWKRISFVLLMTLSLMAGMLIN